MRRRTFLLATLAGAALPRLALAQQQAAPPAAAGPQMIEPQNALEFAFVQAFTNETMRPVFRRYLMDTHVALIMNGPGVEAAPREVPLTLPQGRQVTAALIFTSAARADAAVGPATPRAMINGRAAFERLRGKTVAINAGLLPMLVLEPEDVTRYLEAPGESSAGPSQ
jgi:hypothetical protein